MTVVVAVVSSDGIALASDSATTQTRTLNGVTSTNNIWNSANKIFNLRKTWPLAALTFGRADIEGLSIASHAKDLRCRLTGTVDDPDVAVLDPAAFTVEQVAQAMADYFQPRCDAEPNGGTLGFLVAGIGATEKSPEVWDVLLDGLGGRNMNQVLPPGETGIVHQGMTDAITRLVDGAGQGLGHVLEAMGALPPGAGEPFAETVRDGLRMDWAWPGMPLGETIDMAKFLVDTQINFTRFMPGDAIVGGPVEIAALTKHEGFKWVERKHYYPPELNPTIHGGE
ncbi:hypothetical protein ACFQ0K_08605 [Nocardioides caeni]|uniref:Uncharacterized protein n=1 Tax=Nocardioides caeni TaxID=574700 RepID=A0A4S8N6C7_9ACTN|nr:hypothetical protein [Nocardioides caeni]THV10459.1 hypothetical protein E9934_14105 [Nocardioides caeni]